MTFSYCLNDSEHPALDYLANQLNAGKRIILLTGELGAGKTTFVKHFLNSYLKEPIEVDSPTFSIVNTYASEGRSFHHFDLYRLDSLEEIEDIGLMEYLESGSPCFIEWPEKIAEFLPAEQVIHLSISVSSPQCREFHFS
jgi:tRNA threonylcarbamoyladenosine biosynthesis protein TsaE